MLAERGWQWLRRRAARNWPLAEARVHSAEWRQPRTGTNRYFLADVAYSYVVNGQYYSGYYRRSFSDRDSAATWVEQVRGRALQVRYHPRDISRSLLREQDFAPEAARAAALVPGD